MSSRRPAELLLTNGHVVTGDPARPLSREVAIGGGVILRVGSGAAREAMLAPGAKIVDCAGGAVLPGFIDAHLHFFAFADALVSVDLRPQAGIRSIGELVARLREEAEAAPEGAWIKGKGYNEYYLEEGRHPTRWDLDAASPRHPLKLTHRSHHAHVLNSLALSAVGIDRYTPDPPGGLIDRDLETGEPTGLLFEMGELLSRRIPPENAGRLDAAAARAARELLSAGVTAFQDASHVNDAARWSELGRWQRQGLLPQTASVLLGARGLQERIAGGAAAFPETESLRLGGVKIILDRTAGDVHPAPAELTELVRTAHRSGFPVAIHAVEEETLEAALSALEKAARDPRSGKFRDRIEHCSLCPPRLARRLAELGVAVVTQPSFLFHHGERYARSVPPEQLPVLYPIGSLLRAGVRVAAGSDCPIVPSRPLVGIAAAVARRAESGDVLAPEEGVSVDRALALHTSEAAWALGLERSIGSLAPGRRADLVVLDRNPLTTPVDELSEIEVVMTIIGGAVVWSR